MSIDYPRLVGNGDIFKEWTLTASTQDTTNGYPVANLASWRDDQQWRGTGAAEQYVQAANPTPYANPGDPWDDLSAWNESDVNGSLSVAGNQLLYSWSGPGNDSPQITMNPDPTVAADFAMELPFDVTSWATATVTKVIWQFDFININHSLIFIIDPNAGAARVDMQVNSGSGYASLGTYTLGAAGTAGRIKMRRDAAGKLWGWVYDPNDSSYHSLGTYTGDSDFQVTTLSKYEIRFTTSGYFAGTFSVEVDGVYYATNTGLNSWGVSAHDLATQGAQMRLDASVGGVGWDTLVALVTPTQDHTFAEFFTSAPYNYYRVVVPVGYTAAPTLGILIVAPYLEIPSLPDTPHDPDALDEIGSSMISSTGRYLGGVVEGTMRVQAWRFDYLPFSFVDNEWFPFLRAHARKPFIFLWAPGSRPDEAYFMWITDRQRAQPYNQVHRSIVLNLAGVYEKWQV